LKKAGKVPYGPQKDRNVKKDILALLIFLATGFLFYLVQTGV